MYCGNINHNYLYWFQIVLHRNGKDLVPGSVATFSVDHKSAKELRQYLSNVAEQCETRYLLLYLISSY